MTLEKEQTKGKRNKKKPTQRQIYKIIFLSERSQFVTSTSFIFLCSTNIFKEIWFIHFSPLNNTWCGKSVSFWKSTSRNLSFNIKLSNLFFESIRIRSSDPSNSKMPQTIKTSISLAISRKFSVFLDTVSITMNTSEVFCFFIFNSCFYSSNNKFLATVITMIHFDMRSHILKKSDICVLAIETATWHISCPKDKTFTLYL